MQSWTWPEHVTIDLYHWTWVNSEQGGLIQGWSLAGERDTAGNVLLEPQRHQPGGMFHVEVTSYRTVRHHLFCRVVELPYELLSSDGTPLSWLQQLIDWLTTIPFGGSHAASAAVEEPKVRRMES